MKDGLGRLKVSAFYIWSYPEFCRFYCGLLRGAAQAPGECETETHEQSDSRVLVPFLLQQDVFVFVLRLQEEVSIYVPN